MLPLIAPAIFAGALFAFTMSLDEFVITYFIIGAQITLPIYIYTQIKFGITPAINAVATILIVGSLGISGLGLGVPRVHQDDRPSRAPALRDRRASGRAGLAGPAPGATLDARSAAAASAALPVFGGRPWRRGGRLAYTAVRPARGRGAARSSGARSARAAG